MLVFCGAGCPDPMKQPWEHPAEKCARCGSCTVVCPVFRVDGRESMTARGKMHLVLSPLADHASKTFENLFSQCLLCGACEQVCPRHLPIVDIVSEARSRFSAFYGQAGLQKAAARNVLSRPALLDALVRAGLRLKNFHALPRNSGLRFKLGLLEDRSAIASAPCPESEQAGDVFYFTGCLARYLQPSVMAATRQLLSRCHFFCEIPEQQQCCGLAAWSAGKREEARQLARKNIESFTGSSKPILTSCASCSSHLSSYPALFEQDDPWHERAVAFAERVQEFTQFFNARLAESTEDKRQKKVYYHDPCHLKFTPEGKKNPRELLRRQGIQVVEPDQGGGCCGQGGLFHLAYPETSAKIFLKNAKTALAKHPECVTTTCSGCLMQYQEGFARLGEETRVVHLALLLAGFRDIE